MSLIHRLHVLTANDRGMSTIEYATSIVLQHDETDPSIDRCATVQAGG